jgi:hypothetical protein
MPLKLLAMVRNQSESDVESAPNSTSEDPPAESPTVIFGNNFPKKGANTLRIGFQNIGGLPKNNYKRNNDLLRQGITSHDFDIFGIAKTNVDWRSCAVVYLRTRYTTNISLLCLVIYIVGTYNTPPPPMF